jgi:hypothetical protein
MKRAVAAFITGLFTWVLVISLINRMLRLALTGYAAAEPLLTFTLGMMAARLTMAAVTSLIAGAVVGLIAPTNKRVPWVLGTLLLIVFIPIHVHVWDAFPIWYHLTFLIPLAPLTVLGARLASRTRAAGASPQTVASS